LLAGCFEEDEEEPPQFLTYEKFTVAPSKFHVFDVPYREGYMYASISVKSDRKINVWVLQSNEDVDKFLEKKGGYKSYPHLSRQYDDEYFSSSIVETDLYIVVTNAGSLPANVEVWVVQSQFRSRNY